jgi:hypothetical protein
VKTIMKRKDQHPLNRPKQGPSLPRSRYHIFPPLPPDRHEALKTSITQHGVETSTTWDDKGNLLDGWERETICNELRITCPREVRHFDSEADKFKFILAVNAHRRPSLNQKQKRAVIEAYLLGDAENGMRSSSMKSVTLLRTWATAKSGSTGCPEPQSGQGSLGGTGWQSC